MIRIAWILQLFIEKCPQVFHVAKFVKVTEQVHSPMTHVLNISSSSFIKFVANAPYNIEIHISVLKYEFKQLFYMARDEEEFA